MKRYALILLILSIVLIGCEAVAPGVSPVQTPGLAGGAVDPADVPTLPQFLEMLAGPAGWVLLGAAFSALAARWPWYNQQGDLIKRGLILAGSAVVAIGARLLLTYMPATFWEQTEAYWYIVGGIVMTWLGSQGWYRAVVKPARWRRVKDELTSTGL